MASTRQDLSERQILGEDRLHEDFVARVIIVSILVSPQSLVSPLNSFFLHTYVHDRSSNPSLVPRRHETKSHHMSIRGGKQKLALLTL